MTIGVPKEIHAGERRVAVTPAVAGELRTLGFSIAVESGAGAAAGFDDAAYRQAGAIVSTSARALWSTSDAILKVRPPEVDLESGQDEVDLLRPGQTLVSFVWPGQNPDLLQRIARTGATTLAMDSVPRISRAQKMDALSSMANVAGYRAVVEAAQHFGRFFTGQVTAAGRIAPAKVLVIGAGVAGLAAIGAARSLPGGEGAGEEPGRRLPRTRCRGGGGGRRRLRESDESGVHQSGDGALRQAGRGRGHHHHDRPDSRQARADADHGRHGDVDEAGQCHRRSGRRAGRQL
jgi:hypothetical protein